jgi:hypothetical protein
MFIILISALGLILTIQSLALAQAQTTATYERLKSFGILDQSGAVPRANLIQGLDGALYGTTAAQVGKPAKSPPKPSPIEPGILFYAQNGYVMVANSDGSGIQNLFPVVNWSEFPRPSGLPHSGSYWFLTVRDDGGDNALVAISESGTQVRLDTGSMVNVAGSSDVSNQRWLVSDNKVAFIGRVPDYEHQAYVDYGLYLMDIDWTSGIPVAVGAPQILDWTVSWFANGSYGGYEGCAFSADGSTIYYSFNRDLFKTDVATGTEGGLLVSGFGAVPDISADGNKLVGYYAGYPVQTVGTDGTGLTVVVPSSGVPLEGACDCGIYACWSPTGQNIAYTHYVWRNKRLTSMSEQVTIVSASGTLLGTVGDNPQFTSTLGWRPAR